MNKLITIALLAIMAVTLISSTAIAQPSYTPYDIKATALQFDACLDFIGQSGEAAKKVGLELGEPETLVADADNKILIVKFPMKSPAGPGFALVTCVDGAVVRGQYLYDEEV